MGGAIPTHFVMIIYSYNVHRDQSQILSKLPDECLDTYPKYGTKDILTMYYCHIINVVCLATRNIVLPIFLPRYCYLKSVLQMVHIGSYIFGFLCVQYKLVWYGLGVDLIEDESCQATGLRPGHLALAFDWIKDYRLVESFIFFS